MMQFLDCLEYGFKPDTIKRKLGLTASQYRAMMLRIDEAMEVIGRHKQQMVTFFWEQMENKWPVGARTGCAYTC